MEEFERRFLQEAGAELRERRERLSGVETAAREVAYEIHRMMELGQVPQLPQIRWWYDHLVAALPMPAEPR